jgi:hypothetical protein
MERKAIDDNFIARLKTAIDAYFNHKTTTFNIEMAGQRTERIFAKRRTIRQGHITYYDQETYTNLSAYSPADLSDDKGNSYPYAEVLKAKEALDAAGSTQSASSPITAAKLDKLGGIDFRQMAIVAQPMGSFAGLAFNLPKITNMERIDLNAELAQLSQMINAGIVPSEERIAEYLAVCYQRQELGAYRDGIVACLVNICKLQETQVAETSPRLKELLVLVDTI